MKTVRTLLALLVVGMLLLSAAPASAKNSQPINVTVYNFYCAGDTCDVGMDFTLNGYIPQILKGTVEWRYRLGNGVWSQWTEYRPDNARIFVPWVSEKIIKGSVEFKYSKLIAVDPSTGTVWKISSGKQKVTFTRVLPAK